MASLSQFLSTFAEFFRFIKHYRERQLAADHRLAEERAAERAHQLSLVESIVRGLETISESSAKQAGELRVALVEIAKSSQAQSEGFSNWLKLFQTNSAPTSSVVRDEDELLAERNRSLAQELGVESLPEEFQLAHQLMRGFEADIRGDTRP